MIRIDNVQGITIGKTTQKDGSVYRLMTILIPTGTVQIWLEADDRYGEPAVYVMRKLMVRDQNQQEETT